MTAHDPIITLADLDSRLAQPAPLLLAEILGPQHFHAGHLPGAINLPLEGLAERANQLLPDKQAEIVVYCASETCNNSHIAQRKLLSLGYGNVRVFAGGKAAWKAAGRALVAA